MRQLEKIALKGKVTDMVADAFEALGFTVTEIVEGIHFEMEGMSIVVKSVVKKDTFDLADALAEKVDKDSAKVKREADSKAKKAKALADKEAKAKAKESKE